MNELHRVWKILWIMLNVCNINDKVHASLEGDTSVWDGVVFHADPSEAQGNVRRVLTGTECTYNSAFVAK